MYSTHTLSRKEAWNALGWSETDYQKEMEGADEGFGREGETARLLLYTAAAPCSSYVMNTCPNTLTSRCV